MISNIINITLALTIGLVMMMTVTGTSLACQIEPANTQITEPKARNIARQYLNSLGFSRAGTSIFSASVGKATLRENTWVVRVKTGSGKRLPYKKAVVLINAVNGQIKPDLKN